MKMSYKVMKRRNTVISSKESKEDDAECVAKNKEVQVIFNREEMILNNLLRF